MSKWYGPFFTGRSGDYSNYLERWNYLALSPIPERAIWIRQLPTKEDPSVWEIQIVTYILGVPFKRILARGVFDGKRKKQGTSLVRKENVPSVWYHSNGKVVNLINRAGVDRMDIFIFWNFAHRGDKQIAKKLWSVGPASKEKRGMLSFINREGSGRLSIVKEKEK